MDALKYDNFIDLLFIAFFTLQDCHDTLRHGISIDKILVDYLVWVTNTNTT